MPSTTPTQSQKIDPSLDLVAEIKRLKTEMNAVILAHYYQDDEIQDIADFIGDSLDLSRKAQASNADVIVFCGVKFMAEVAKILSPNKTVILPDLNAGCSLEDSCKPDEFKKFRALHPNHIALTYINCSADIKALSDIIVTSSCAEKIINQIPQNQPILFSPDKHLGAYLAKKTGRDMLLWNGTCMVHVNFSERELIKLKAKNPQAKTIAHPECPEELLRHADFIGSTSALLNYTKQNSAGQPENENKAAEYIVLTEPGILHQMRKYSPNAKFYDVAGVSDINAGACANCNNCPYMKLNTLEKLYLAMLNKTPQIELEPELALRAKASLDKMLEMSA
jgi:quinolinate synthase